MSNYDKHGDYYGYEDAYQDACEDAYQDACEDSYEDAYGYAYENAYENYDDMVDYGYDQYREIYEDDFQAEMEEDKFADECKKQTKQTCQKRNDVKQKQENKQNHSKLITKKEHEKWKKGPRQDPTKILPFEIMLMIVLYGYEHLKEKLDLHLKGLNYYEQYKEHRKCEHTIKIPLIALLEHRSINRQWSQLICHYCCNVVKFNMHDTKLSWNWNLIKNGSNLQQKGKILVILPKYITESTYYVKYVKSQSAIGWLDYVLNGKMKGNLPNQVLNKIANYMSVYYKKERDEKKNRISYFNDNIERNNDYGYDYYDYDNYDFYD